jgi:hypothetical protein
MSDQEDHIDQLEREIPAMAASAFAEARAKVLAAGLSVLQSEQGSIYEVFPNGDRVLVKKIKPPITVVPGTIITIR